MSARKERRDFVAHLNYVLASEDLSIQCFSWVYASPKLEENMPVQFS